MKLNIDLLMITLLIVFVVSFAFLLVYGEIWQVNLSTQSARTPIDMTHAQIAFAASCTGIASGALILYMTEKFAQGERKQNAVSPPIHDLNRGGSPSSVERSAQE